jgi:hypothetical protein
MWSDLKKHEKRSICRFIIGLFNRNILVKKQIKKLIKNLWRLQSFSQIWQNTSIEIILYFRKVDF